MKKIFRNRYVRVTLDDGYNDFECDDAIRARAHMLGDYIANVCNDILEDYPEAEITHVETTSDVYHSAKACINVIFLANAPDDKND